MSLKRLSNSGKKNSRPTIATSLIQIYCRVRLPVEFVDSIRDDLGELPAITRARLQSQHGIKLYDADVIVNQGKATIDYFEAAATVSGDAKKTSSWVMQDVMRTMKDQGLRIESFPVTAQTLGELVKEVSDGKLDTSRGRDVFEHLLAQPSETIAQAKAALGIESVDDDALVQLCEQLLADNPQVVADVKDGKQQAVGALIGQARKKNPNANPQAVRQTLLDLIARE